MANEEGSRGPEGLQPDPLAEQLAPDGAAVLLGILGKGPTDEDWYLFLDRELTRRAEFKASDVLHSEKIRAEDPPFLGTQGTRVYLRRGARVVYTTTGSREVQAEFLGGAIAESSLATSSGMTGAIPATVYHPPVTVDPYLCPLTIQAAAWGVASITPGGFTTWCGCPHGPGCGGTLV
jgi:hypothetical protein